MTVVTRRWFLGASLLSTVGLTGCDWSPAPSAIDPRALGPSPRVSGGSAASAPAFTRTPPLSLTSSASLAEDYLLVTPASTTSSDDRVTAFRTPNGSTEAVLLIGKTLYHLKRDPQQHGGFDLLPIPDATGVLEVVAGQASNQVVLFYRTTARVTILRLDADGSWQPMGRLAWHTTLQVAYSGAEELIVYCYDGDAATVSFYVVGSDLGRPHQGSVYGIPASSGVALAAAVSAVAQVYACDSSGTVYAWQANLLDGATAKPLTALNLPGSRAAEEVVAAFANLGGGFPVVRDADGNLWAVPSASAAVQIWDAAALGAATHTVGVFRELGGDNTLLDLYVVSESGVSVIHQVDQSQAGTSGRGANALHPVFAPPIPLAPHVVDVSTPSGRPTDAVSLVTVDESGALAVLSRASATTGWSSQPVHLPATEPQQLTTYRVQLTVGDAYGLPCPGTALTITADRDVLALLPDQTTAMLGDVPFSMTTDTTGRAVLAVVADGLSAPNLTIAAEGLRPVVVNPAQEVYAFLAGTASLNYLGQFDADSLQAASVGGQPLAPSLSQKTAAEVVQALHAAVAVGGGFSTAVRAGSSTEVGQASGRLQGPIEVGGVSMSLAGFAHDIWHAVKTGVASVAHVAVAVSQDARTVTATVTVRIEGWGEQQLTFVVKTVDDAVNVAHSLFGVISASVPAVVRWLRADLSGLLGDSVALARQLRSWLADAPTALSGFVKDLSPKVDHLLTDLRGEIDTTLQNVPANVRHASLSSLSQPESLQTAPPGGQLGAAAKVDPAWFSANCHANWLVHKLTHLFDGPDLGPTSSTLSTLNATLLARLQENGGELEDDLHAYWRDVLSKLTSPDTFEHLTVEDLLTGLADVLRSTVDLMQTVADAASQLLAAVLDVLAEMLSGPTGDLPLIGDLLKAHGLGSIDVGMLACLLVAYPATLLYKLSHGAGATLLAGSSATEQLQATTVPLEDALRYLGIATEGLWAFFDSVIDAAQVDTTFFAVIDITMPLLLGVFTYPGRPDGAGRTAIPFTTPPAFDLGKGDGWTFAGWFLALVPPLFSAALQLDQDQQLRTILRRLEPQGPWLISGIGGLMFLSGATANIQTGAGLAPWAVATLGSLPVFSSFLALKAVVAETDEVSLMVKCLIDFFCGVGTGFGMAYA